MTAPSTPPTVPPDKRGPSTGKVVLLGCLGAFLIVVVVAGIAAVAWYLMRDDAGRAGDGPAGSGDRETVTVGPGPGAWEGTLAAGDRERGDGSWYDAYSLTAAAGERLVVTMRSSDFDAYLTVVSPGQEQQSDDDSGGGTDARLEIEVDEPGAWTVMANAYRPGEGGSYTLEIER